MTRYEMVFWASDQLDGKPRGRRVHHIDADDEQDAIRKLGDLYECRVNSDHMILQSVRACLDNQVFRDPAVKNADSFRVIFNEKLCSPDFNSWGAAAAYLDMLTRGDRKPE